MQYFIDHIQQYASVNLKGSDLQDFVSRYENMIIADYDALCQLRDTIKSKIVELDKDYPRTIPLSFDVTGRQWTVYPKGKPDKIVLYIQFKEVRGIYRVSNARL